VILTGSAERDALIESAHRLIADRYDSTGYADRLRAAETFDQQKWADIAELGWLATAVSEENGGLDLGYSLLSDLTQALAPGLLLEPFLSQVGLGVPLLDLALPERQKDTVLGRLLSGQEIVAFAHHETRTGEYFNEAVGSTFVHQDESFILNGCKAVVVDGAIADQLIISCIAPGTSDVNLFLLPASSTGISTTRYRSFDGRNVADIEFTGVKVPLSARLQYSVPMTEVINEVLGLYALLIASESFGIMQTLLKLTHRYLNEREQFGTKIGNFQALQHRLADMLLATVRTESLLTLARHQCAELGPSGAAAMISALKYQTGIAGAYIAQESIQMHGAIGMTDEFIVGHFLKRLTANDFMAGNADEHLSKFIEQRGMY